MNFDLGSLNFDWREQISLTPEQDTIGMDVVAFDPNTECFNFSLEALPQQPYSALRMTGVNQNNTIINIKIFADGTVEL